MAKREYKQYTIQAKRGIKGEAYFEQLISGHSIPHHVSGPKDVGIDYFCEWVFGDMPTGVLFAAQIKTFSEDNITKKYIGVAKQHNGLCEYRIANSLLKISRKTLEYWKGLAIPIFLFVVTVKTKPKGESLNCYYKRYTPSLSLNKKLRGDQFYKEFFKVNKNNTFLAFKDPAKRTQGFARDLFIDHIRWNYCKGSIAYINPRHIGLNQFYVDSIFPEFFDKYKVPILETYAKTQSYLVALKKSINKPKKREPRAAS